jgi:predicted pyridoxine 5'-phosphate oxidase superfamily flavin-nucleotide-binding protein
MDGNRITSVAELRTRMGDASAITASKVDTSLDEFGRDFIARAPFLVLSTADAQGRQDASPKGDAPGFVAVLDDRTLAIPDRKGNKLL